MGPLKRELLGSRWWSGVCESVCLRLHQSVSVCQALCLAGSCSRGPCVNPSCWSLTLSQGSGTENQGVILTVVFGEECGGSLGWHW